ncbi:nuclear transport factor 2 family protein [Oceanobacillus halophilus]|uniref:Nuclear transport factor 2 family protein n=1 Tax=Oceanobacillus halophilus TaxID=930130 RepID=A0A495A091_9BACI|nr:nuclear transport factor 2 family protein [Oceanobacillus halophilus]RKQ32691.1 nuclear transport factor 2 family protein [Oceanobacillus halophilus]
MAKQEDIKVVCPEDCGNAPKKQILRDFNVATVQNKTELVLDYITDDVVWSIVGSHQVVGKDNFLKEINKKEHVTELHIDNIITHGKTASLNGVYMEESRKVAFCHVYLFNKAGKSGKIKEITTYIINLP